MDQKDQVDEREENIKEINKMMLKVNDISKQMKGIILEMDQDLDGIRKKQDDIDRNAGMTNKEMVETDKINKKKLKKVFIWTLIIIVLALCIIGIVYLSKGNKDKENNNLKNNLLARNMYLIDLQNNISSQDLIPNTLEW